MKGRIATLALSGVFVVAMAGLAQERPAAPQAQPVDEPKTVPSAETRPVSKVPPSTGTTVTIQGTAPAPPNLQPQTTTTTTTIEAPVPPPPAPPPVAVETTTTATEYETLPTTASPYPSLALGGLTLLAAAGLLRRKPATR